MGTGNKFALSPPTYLKSGVFSEIAAAFATASETPKIAFAPNLDLFSVPSILIINLSIAF